MIHLFPASFVKPGAKAGYATVLLEMDDTNREMFESFFNSPMGKQFLIVAYEIEKDAPEIEKLHTKPDHQKTVLMKKLHAMMGDYASQTDLDISVIKRILRAHLKGKGLIKESLSELDEIGLATAIYNLNVYLHPTRFDYGEYLNDDSLTNRGS